jgi:hypothetical protein
LDFYITSRSNLGLNANFQLPQSSTRLNSCTGFGAIGRANLYDQRRNLEDKESDTYVKGKLIPRKKVKKEVSRHSLLSWQIMSIPGMHPANAQEFLK